MLCSCVIVQFSGGIFVLVLVIGNLFLFGIGGNVVVCLVVVGVVYNVVQVVGVLVICRFSGCCGCQLENLLLLFFELGVVLCISLNFDVLVFDVIGMVVVFIGCVGLVLIFCVDMLVWVLVSVFFNV